MFDGIVPHVGGPILPPGEPTVLIGFLPAARMTDMATCVGPPDSILMGSPTVLIGNLMAARIGDPTDHGGVIVLGEPTVEIGEVGMGTPTVVTPAPPLVILAQAMSGSGSAAAQAVSNAAQDLAQASQDGAATVALKLANQPLASAAGAQPGAAPAPAGFSDSTIDSVVQSSARGRNSQITEGARAIQKKLGHAQGGGYQSAFDGVEPTQENAEAIIRDVMKNPQRVAAGKKTVDAYNAAGQGVRFDAQSKQFVGFLELGKATR